MSFIQFESAKDKEKLRQELREARDHMLEKAKKDAEIRAELRVQNELKGENNWMLPSVAAKIEKLSKRSKKSKKSKNKKQFKKKTKKTKSKKKKRHSSSSEEDSDSNSESSSSSEEDRKKSRKRKSRSKKKKTKKDESDSSDSSAGHIIQKKKKKKDWDNDSDSSSSTTSSGTESNKNEQWVEKQQTVPTIQRDSWMTDSSVMLKTFEKQRSEKKTNEKQHIDSYDPAKSSRELNPYWKLTGTGLPCFQKPSDDVEFEARRYKHTGGGNKNYDNSSKNWQKKRPDENIRKKATPPPNETSSSSEDDEKGKMQESKSTLSTSLTTNFLTDQQMNELAAKVLKAELMGNMDVVEELKSKLELARKNRSLIKERKMDNMQQQHKVGRKTEEEHILLTHTDERGNSRPLGRSQAPFDTRDLYGGRKGKKKQSKRVETHENGERVRFFPDDDRYDIKQMFEREKYTNAADSNLEFANIVSKHKNPNDDLDDIFADKIRKNHSQEKSEMKEVQRAINEHQRLSTKLENCDKCFDSDKMDKKLLVSLGDKIYLSLPSYQGLVPGHCLLVTTHHVTCSTQLDEDAWEELNDFRKALTRMFAAQKKDVIYYEIANKLHRRPHLTIHCIPIPDTDAEMAPFYFKKALEESEQEWCVNKQLISLKNKNLTNAVPKGLPYFWVNFGMDTGFAHVIEDQERFPVNFALEIIGGMLQLNAQKWRRPHQDTNIILKVKMFADWWKKYDCTK